MSHALRVSSTSRFGSWIAGFGLLSGLFFAASMTANAQFKEVGPPPVSAPVAREQIRTLLEKVDPGNRQQTVATISGLLTWYRDLIDEELIAAWQKDGRAKIADLMESLADAHLASAIVGFSWRRQRQTTFTPAYAPMLGHLMARYQDSAKPFLDDLLGATATGQQALDLSQGEAEAVCRILLDMPDVRTWKKSALQILPHYRQDAENLLVQDLQGSDRGKSNRAQLWLTDLKAVDAAFDVQRAAALTPPDLSAQSAPKVLPATRAGVILTPLNPVAVEGTLRSINYTTGAAIDFVNRSSGPVDVYWVNYQGARRLERAGLAVGATLTEFTFLTHPFLVVVSGTGGTLAQGTGTRLAAFEAVTPRNALDPSIRDTAIITDPAGTNVSGGVPAPAADGPGTMGADGVYKAGNGVSQPSLLSKVDTEYPEVARKLRVDGYVYVRLIVQPDGTPRDVELTGPLGYGLDEKTVEAVRKWRFKPAMKDGKPVAVRASVGSNAYRAGQRRPDTWNSGQMDFAREAGLAPPAVRDGTMPNPGGDVSDESAVLEFTVDASGGVRNIQTVHGSQSASQLLPRYLATWKFRPGIKGAQPVEVVGRVRFVKGQGDEAAKLALLTPPFPSANTAQLERAPRAASSAETIAVRSGTYGSICGQPKGNETKHLAQVCDGKRGCDYTVDHSVIGDPAPNCRKDYIAEWDCGSVAYRASAEPEAGLGSVVRLSCGQSATATASRPYPKPTITARAGTNLTPLDPGTVDDAMASTAGATAAAIDFVNRTNGPVDIYWIDYKGNRVVSTAGLAVGATFSALTYLTHPFLVVVSGTGGTTAQDTGTRLAGFEAVTPRSSLDPSIRDTAIITSPDTTSTQPISSAGFAGTPVSNAGENRTMVNATDGQRYVWIPPGVFTMGCSPGDTECDNNEKPPHQVRIAGGFWLGQTEVTQAAYMRVTGGNPSSHKGDQLPVETLTWNNAANYCRAISGRLPTENEWEYAARGGVTWARYGNLDAVAWNAGNGGAMTHPVASKQQNAFGLYDMLGNVWEWVEDSYAGTASKILRGGSTQADATHARASRRWVTEPAAAIYRGFRCAGEFTEPDPKAAASGSEPARALNLLALYKLSGDGSDATGLSGPFSLANTFFRGGSLYLNGVYEHAKDVYLNGVYVHAKDWNGYLAIAPVPRLNYLHFTAALDFNAETFNPPKNAILYGGTAWRWWGLGWKDGVLELTLNNGSFRHAFEGGELSQGAWHNVICSVDLPAGVIRTVLDGKALPDVQLPQGFRLEVIGTEAEARDKSFTFTNYSNAAVFQGYVNNLRIYGESLSAEELQILYRSIANQAPGNGGGSASVVGAGDGGAALGAGGGVTGSVFNVGGGVSAPAVIYKVDPEYSEEARKAKYSGTVMLSIVVDTEGRARDIRVVKSLGLGLDEKAIQALEKWRFKPAQKDGRPVNARSTIEVNFRLL
jgi:TonB family protein